MTPIQPDRLDQLEPLRKKSEKPKTHDEQPQAPTVLDFLPVVIATIM